MMMPAVSSIREDDDALSQVLVKKFTCSIKGQKSGTGNIALLNES